MTPRLVALCLAALCRLEGAEPPTVTPAQVEHWMQSLSNWGRWGKADEMGALNLITPEKRRRAAGLVRDGVSISLAHPAIKVRADGSPAFEHRMIEHGLQAGAQSAGDLFSVQYHGFTVTHLDALCHIFYKGRMYNGYSQREVGPEGAARLSVYRIRDGIFTRAVLMDIPRLVGRDYLEGSRKITVEDLEAWEKKAGLRVSSGDAILIRTGRWARRKAQGPWDIMKNSAGLHASCLPWLKKRDVAIVGSDLATDVMPSGVQGIVLPVHQVLVVAMGVPILDNLDLERAGAECSARGRWEFLLTASPLPVEGATGSPINPIGTF